MGNRSLTVLAVLAMMLSFWPQHARAEVIEQIVAKVNDDIITLTQFNQEKESRYKALKSRYKGEELLQKYNESVKQILPDLIDELLLVQKAEEFGMTEDLDLEAKAYIQDLMKQNNIPTEDALKQEMGRSGITWSTWYANLKKFILVNRIKGAMVRQKVKIMKSDVDNYYSSHADEFTQPAEVQLEEIVLYTKDKDADQVRTNIEAIADKLKTGADFNELAKADSEGPTASEGGNIGSFAINALSPAIAKAVESLQPGQVSGVIETDFGFEIIRLLKRTEARKQPLSEVQEKIEDKLWRAQINPVLHDYLKEIRKESYIYVFPEYRQDYNPDASDEAPNQAGK